MSRVALFVDAGYLLAGAHDLMGGPITRSAYDCDYATLLSALRQEVESRSVPLTFLRTYWYDGARDGIATADHRRIGEQDYVKVRLGRLNMKGQQKGVDGLIYRDLTTLARAGVIHRAYLFTGDEDIRESVAAAQDLGVQVVLMAFKPTAQTGRSAELAREADEVIILDSDFWPPHFAKRQTIAPSGGPPAPATLATVAEVFAHDWASGATAAEVRELLKSEPQMPRELYVQLVLEAEKTTGSLKEYGKQKGELRTEFWRAVRAEIGDSGAPTEEAPSVEPTETD
jgi:uncharacterized LabA/DUF88 family protein